MLILNAGEQIAIITRKEEILFIIKMIVGPILLFVQNGSKMVQVF